MLLLYKAIQQLNRNSLDAELEQMIKNAKLMNDIKLYTDMTYETRRPSWVQAFLWSLTQHDFLFCICSTIQYQGKYFG